RHRGGDPCPRRQRRPRAPYHRARRGGAPGATRLPVSRRAPERDRHRPGRRAGRRAARPSADHRTVHGSEPGARAIAVVGSVAFDRIETPIGRAEDVLGGSATYFALAASYFAPVHLVAVVGEDFPESDREFLGTRGIDLSGLEVRPGRTFRWTGRYHEDLNVRDTLSLELNVFADFRPILSETVRKARIVYLGNIDPALQETVLEQFDDPAVVACDTMNHWIANAREPLEALLPRVDLLVLNDEEAR